MTIINQDGTYAVNYDNCAVIVVNGPYVHSHSNDGSVVSLGSYASEERAKEVLLELMDALTETDYIDVIQNIGIAREKFITYRMPEE